VLTWGLYRAGFHFAGVFDGSKMQGWEGAKRGIVAEVKERRRRNGIVLWLRSRGASHKKGCLIEIFDYEYDMGSVAKR